MLCSALLSGETRYLTIAMTANHGLKYNTFTNFVFELTISTSALFQTEAQNVVVSKLAKINL